MSEEIRATRQVPTHWKPSCLYIAMGHRLGPQASALAFMGQFPQKTSDLNLKRAAEMAQGFMALAALPEISGSIPSTHVETHNQL